MRRIPVILIFDVGKTNKKLLLFDEKYQLVYSESIQISETIDEDNFPCENLLALNEWIMDSFQKIAGNALYQLKAVNFSGYGASFIYLDKEGKRIAPLYNYLKPYPIDLRKQFYATYGGENTFALQTASPVLESLNSGMQLYRIKNEQPALFHQIGCALHLPQYLSFLLTGHIATGITSIGCHTNLWNFPQQKYHEWVNEENIEDLFGPITDYQTPIRFEFQNKIYLAGIGLHDSSAALIPYQLSFGEPFVLISTGTWSISLNPFNNSPLTEEELQQDCLCYLSYKGNPVKASRLFAGNIHEQYTKILADHFNTTLDHYKTVKLDLQILTQLKSSGKENAELEQHSKLLNEDLCVYNSYTEAYHHLVMKIVALQVRSTNLVLNSGTNKIFVDGGFSNNPIFMQLLADCYAEIEVFGASIPQASALGAALTLHNQWNPFSVPTDMINLKYYAPSQRTSAQ